MLSKYFSTTKIASVIAVSIAFLFIASYSTAWCGDWPTFGHDAQRSGWAVEEDALNAQNVSGLKLLWKVTVKNQPRSLTALTAPVVADGVTTPAGIRTVVYVAGSSDNISAIDAGTGAIVWTRTFESHVLPKDAGMWLCPDNLNATPTIDERRRLIYAIASDGKFYGLDLGTGKTKAGPVQLVPPFSKNWSLNLWKETAYTSISQECGGARSGIYSINLRHPDRPAIHDLLVTRSGSAGIWGRGGVAIGDDGRIFASTGDGNFSPSQNEYGSSLIEVRPGRLKVIDYYSPLNFNQITKLDLDIAASSLIWFPYRNYRLVAGGGKEGALYMLDADSLGAKDHQTPLYRQKLANDQLEFEGLGIWGELSSWMDLEGNRWLYVPIWGPVSKDALQFPVTLGPHPHGSLMAFKVAINPSTKKPTLQPAWISGDFDVPEPVAIANGVIFALSTGENTLQTAGPGFIHHGLKLLTDQQRSEHTHNAVLYALDAKTGKVLYESSDAIASWVHFSGLAIADGHVYAVDHSSTLYCFGLASQ
ncbi:MAG TPA: PQQ-binding-like beta-propeller repeat protein [Terriglobia bacterium]|nr:PQQ-binding-like beta-propeller repeat protein [Terriglobia bacterium]